MRSGAPTPKQRAQRKTREKQEKNQRKTRERPERTQSEPKANPERSQSRPAPHKASSDRARQTARKRREEVSHDGPFLRRSASAEPGCGNHYGHPSPVICAPLTGDSHVQSPVCAVYVPDRGWEVRVQGGAGKLCARAASQSPRADQPSRPPPKRPSRTITRSWLGTMRITWPSRPCAEKASAGFRPAISAREGVPVPVSGVSQNPAP